MPAACCQTLRALPQLGKVWRTVLGDSRPGELGPARPEVCRCGPWKQRGIGCLEKG